MLGVAPGQPADLLIMVPGQGSRSVLKVHKRLGFAAVGNEVLSLGYLVLKDLEADFEIQLLGVYY